MASPLIYMYADLQTECSSVYKDFLVRSSQRQLNLVTLWQCRCALCRSACALRRSDCAPLYGKYRVSARKSQLKRERSCPKEPQLQSQSPPYLYRTGNEAETITVCKVRKILSVCVTNVRQASYELYDLVWSLLTPLYYRNMADSRILVTVL